MNKRISAHLLLFLSFFITTKCWANNDAALTRPFDKKDRLGVGINNQLINDIPGISLKIQKTRLFAIGGIFNFKVNSDTTQYGIGLKAYRLIFEESNLNFYANLLLAVMKDHKLDDSKKDIIGWQTEFSLGSEFHIPGINSIGFSFEFGLRLSKLRDKMTLDNTGYNFLQAGIHFYL